MSGYKFKCSTEWLIISKMRGYVWLTCELMLSDFKEKRGMCAWLSFEPLNPGLSVALQSFHSSTHSLSLPVYLQNISWRWIYAEIRMETFSAWLQRKKIPPLLYILIIEGDGGRLDSWGWIGFKLLSQQQCNNPRSANEKSSPNGTQLLWIGESERNQEVSPHLQTEDVLLDQFPETYTTNPFQTLRLWRMFPWNVF